MNTPLRTSEDHFQKLARLLDLEAEAEKQETIRSLERQSPAEAEASGNSLINLVIREEDSGLGGRILLTFGKRNENLSLPYSRIGNGSPVILSEEGFLSIDDPTSRGIDTRAHKDAIQVAFRTQIRLRNCFARELRD